MRRACQEATSRVLQHCSHNGPAFPVEQVCQALWHACVATAIINPQLSLLGLVDDDLDVARIATAMVEGQHSNTLLGF